MEAQRSYRQRVVSAEDVVVIRQLIAEHPQASRRALSKRYLSASAAA